MQPGNQLVNSLIASCPASFALALRAHGGTSAVGVGGSA